MTTPKNPSQAAQEPQGAVPFADKACGCGRTYDEAGWAALPLRGVLDDRGVNADGERIEMRNCSCGSTLAIVTHR